MKKMSEEIKVKFKRNREEISKKIKTILLLSSDKLCNMFELVILI